MFLQNYKTKWKTKNYKAVIIQTTAFFTLLCIAKMSTD